MALSQQIIAEDLKKAIKEKDEVRASALRLLKTALKNMEVDKRRVLREEEIQSVISSMIRKNKEAAEEFRRAGRAELAAKEEKEIEILQGYLPEQLAPEEIESILRDVIAEQSASGPRDLGKVMKAAMAKMAGRAQGKEVNRIAQKLLS